MGQAQHVCVVKKKGWVCSKQRSCAQHVSTTGVSNARHHHLLTIYCGGSLFRKQLIQSRPFLIPSQFLPHTRYEMGPIYFTLGYSLSIRVV
jgi:hypothetical protein